MITEMQTSRDRRLFIPSTSTSPVSETRLTGIATPNFGFSNQGPHDSSWFELAPRRRQHMPDESHHRRSTMVPLEIAVFISTRTRDGKVLEGEGFTRTVNAHGGLLEAPFRMAPRQYFTLMNRRSKEGAKCGVLQVNRPSDGFFPTAFEIFACNPQFWPVSSAPADWGLNRARSEVWQNGKELGPMKRRSTRLQNDPRCAVGEDRSVIQPKGKAS